MVQKIKFQWYFDFSTSADSMQIITVSAGGKDVVARLKPFFGAYKYYKLGSVSCSLVPASTLPVDPTGLSYEAGENTVDPRDQLNPGLTRITNGEDFLDDLTGFTETQIEQIYEAMVVDTRWYKWSLQSGLKRKAYPKYWQIGQLHQDYFPGATVNVPALAGTPSQITGTDSIVQFEKSNVDHSNNGVTPGYVMGLNSDPRGFFQTGHKGTLSWMPTDALAQYATAEGIREQTAVAPIPSVELFKIITPKAHKTVYYYRCYVTETVYFRGPITSSSLGTGMIGIPGPMLDRFIYGSLATNPLPGNLGTPNLNPPNDGAGDNGNN